jgi:hypothetical protein
MICPDCFNGWVEFLGRTTSIVYLEILMIEKQLNIIPTAVHLIK